MKAIVWQGPEGMTIEERPDPADPGAGELILRPEAVGICGSEVEGYPEDVAAACLFAVSLPPRAYVPELTILPTALQAIGRTS